VAVVVVVVVVVVVAGPNDCRQIVQSNCIAHFMSSRVLDKSLADATFPPRSLGVHCDVSSVLLAAVLGLVGSRERFIL